MLLLVPCSSDGCLSEERSRFVVGQLRGDMTLRVLLATTSGNEKWGIDETCGWARRGRCADERRSGQSAAGSSRCCGKSDGSRSRCVDVVATHHQHRSGEEKLLVLLLFPGGGAGGDGVVVAVGEGVLRLLTTDWCRGHNFLFIYLFMSVFIVLRFFFFF